VRGHSIGCETIQMFTRNANIWRSKPLSEADMADFAQARLATDIRPVVAHSSYLINLASANDELWIKSQTALRDELVRCQQLGIPRYVLHPGACTGSAEATGLARVAEALDEVLEATASGGVTILLETTAGQGTSLGASFEQLAWLIDKLPTPRLGVCFDTAHAFAAGYDLRTPETYAATWLRFDELIGLRRLGCIHLNDSKRELGSRVDRHEQLGKGCLGVEPFRMLVNDPLLRHVPMILETPKGEEMLEDVENLTLLRKLVRPSTHSRNLAGGVL
jgi:deoxyribonuclease-4